MDILNRRSVYQISRSILQLDVTLNTKMKGRRTSEYVRRVRKLCRSKLNGGNMISGINTWAVSVLRYSAGIVDWKMEELLAWIEELGKF